MWARIYVRKYDEDYKKKMKISFIVFLLIITSVSLLNGNLGLLSIPIFLVLLSFFWIAVKFIIPHLAEKTKKEIQNKNLEKILTKSALKSGK